MEISDKKASAANNNEECQENKECPKIKKSISDVLQKLSNKHDSESLTGKAMSEEVSDENLTILKDRNIITLEKNPNSEECVFQSVVDKVLPNDELMKTEVSIKIQFEI